MVMHSFNPSMQKAEAGRSLRLGPVSYRTAKATQKNNNNRKKNPCLGENKKSKQNFNEQVSGKA